MSEHPNAIFGWLLAAALALAAVIANAVAALGLTGVVGLAGMIVGALTACVFFLAELGRVPLSSLVLVFLALATLAAFVRTLCSYRRERRLLSALPLAPLADADLLAVAAEADVEVYLTPARRAAAFCFGLVRPRVVITSGLLERLTSEEQAAVIWHEAEHAHAREPARCLVARLAASSFFWIPALRDLLERFLLVKEIAADREAASHTSTAALAGALFEVATPTPALAAVGAGDLAAARIERLFARESPLPVLFRCRHLLLSAVGATALALTITFRAQLDLGEQAHLKTMLLSLSVHGLPGMAAGFAVNAAILTYGMMKTKRLLRARRR